VIEGRPGEEHEATVTKVEPLAKTRDYRSPVKYFEATLSLARTDPSFMKPGQKVRAVVRLEDASPRAPPSGPAAIARQHRAPAADVAPIDRRFHPRRRLG
jgi:hypothetical protein